MNMLKDIPDLLNAGIISQETADKIHNHYASKRKNSANRIFIVFGIFGAILVGLGIILLVAHNWDNLSRTTKSFFAFLPLVLGQILCGFVLIKKNDSVIWRESASAFLFFAVGACLSLITQIYNIPGNLSSFLLTWMLLCLPLIYIMRSSLTSLLYLTGVTYYACETGYWIWSQTSSETYLYWPLLTAALPHYYLLYKEKPESNFMIFHNWLIPLSLIISLGTVAKETGDLMYIAYYSLFGLLHIIGNSTFFQHQKFKNNGYKILGSIGTIVLLLILSFDWFWHDIRNQDLDFNELITSPEFFASVIISLLCLVLLYFQTKNKPSKDLEPISFVFILFIITFILGQYSSVSVVFINFFVFAIGLITIFKGARMDHLGVLNYGLLIIMALVVCRFFDNDLSFVIRGILFVSAGIGFFATNYWMLKKREANE